MVSECYNCDCLSYMRTVPDKFFDLAVVDPPYGINAPNMQMGGHDGYQSTATKLRKGRLNQGAGKLKNRALNTLSCDWDFEPPGPEYFDELFRVSKNQIIWGGNYFPLPPTRGIICWDKLQPWENFSQVELAWTSFDCPAKLVRISSRGGANEEEKIHPTQKPIELYSWIFEKFSRGGGRKYLILTSVAVRHESRPTMPGLTSTVARSARTTLRAWKSASRRNAWASRNTETSPS